MVNDWKKTSEELPCEHGVYLCAYDNKPPNVCIFVFFENIDTGSMETARFLNSLGDYESPVAWSEINLPEYADWKKNYKPQTNGSEG